MLFLDIARRLGTCLAVAASLLVLSTGATGCAADADDEELTEEEELTASEEQEARKSGGRRFEVLQHNIGGGTENDAGEAGIKYTFSAIDATKPDVVMLEEVCVAQYELFKARYPGWSVLWAPMTQNVGNDRCGGTAKGQVLASPRAMAEMVRKDLGESDGERQFTLLCGGVPIPGTQRKVIACVTHLRAGKDDPAVAAARAKQVWRIADTLKSAAKTRAVVIGGDLNANPGEKELDPLYRLTRSGGYGGGRFDEADQTDPQRAKYSQRDGVKCAAAECRTGEGTMAGNRSKLDYVFFSHNRVVGKLGAAVDASGGSAHNLYRGWANLAL